MSDVVIKAEGLGKKYRIRQAQAAHQATLRDAIATGAGRLLRPWKRPAAAGPAVHDFWALKDVTFEVRRGQIVGIVGRNGAGKSTLLKVLSRITEPSEGRVLLNGRVASLLEVGTGFHPELSGRENIYLNGAILGMLRAEIRRKFDEIVAFAEIEEFLDTPVKRYSSGMYVRLAFAVAAHLEPEILVVDEVLAVGDVEFQKKCLGKMDEVSKGGRTVLLVSHDMRRISGLCDRGILLDGGRIALDGDVSTVADTYLLHRKDAGHRADLSGRGDRSGSGEGRFQSIELSSAGQPGRTVSVGGSFTQKFTIRVFERIGRAVVSTIIKSRDGTSVYEFLNVDDDCEWVAEVGTYSFAVTIDRLMLYPGTYSIDLWLGSRTMARIDYVIETITFVVVQSPESGLPRQLDPVGALVFERAAWKCDELAPSAG